MLYDTSWEGYEALLAVLSDRPIRVIYNRGEMDDTTLFRQFHRWLREHLLSQYLHGFTVCNCVEENLFYCSKKSVFSFPDF